ncbi:MAG: FemAB family PEP-CTERM system-associated protein [Gammaproteobacteria bacterium]|nr:FemAB family PEP-CTERM system-associated protein [Gammaproteobacteria bacterium]
MLFNICEADKVHFQRCNEFVRSSDCASVYHLTDWCELISDVFKHRCYYFMAESSEQEIIGVLPLVRLKSKLFGDYMVSMPYFNYGGAVATIPEVEEALISCATAKAAEIGLRHIEFRDIKPRDIKESVRTDKVAMILPLPDNQEVLWKKLGAKRRSQINRPLREDVNAKNGREELLNDFYQVFSHNMRDLGTPVYSKLFFSEILRRFPDNTHIVIIYHKGKPVGSAFLIGFRDQLEIPWASTLRSVNSIGVNMLLYWEVLKYAMASGYKSFDFGRSSVDSGTYRFKKQWGAEPKQLYWHYWLNAGQQMPKLTPSNPKYQLAISAWQRLPLFVANRIGPLIVKNLP